MRNARTLSEVMAGITPVLISSEALNHIWAKKSKEIRQIYTLRNVSQTLAAPWHQPLQLPIYPDLIVNKLTVTVYKHGGKHIEIDIVFLINIVPEIFIIEQIVLIFILYQSQRPFYTWSRLGLEVDVNLSTTAGRRKNLVLGYIWLARRPCHPKGSICPKSDWQ